MLEFLQTGKALYVLLAACGLGVFSKLVTSSLYKRLIKETGNMALTKNKNLRSLKQKTENMFLVSQGIRNVNAYIEKQIYGFRFMNLSLDVWENVSMQAMILCFLIGGLAAFGAYWYRCDSYYIVLYGTIGILSGLFLVLVDNGVNASLKRQQLMDTLVDYVENSPHFHKPGGKLQESFDVDKRAVAAVEKEPMKADKKSSEAKHPLLTRKKATKALVRKPEVVRNEAVQTIQKPESGLSRNEEQLAKSIDSLKQSLEQIAASRERERRDLQVVKSPELEKTERPRKELSEADLKFLGELLQEYLT